MLDHALERPVLRDQLSRGLVADSRDSGNVVGGVPLEADEVRNLLRAEPVAGLDALRRVHLDVRDPSGSHHQAHVLGAELERVAIRRDDARSHTGGVGPSGEGRDHVVGLPALELEVPVTEGLDDRPEMRELLAQQVGHRASLGLVLLRHLLAVNRPGVPGHRNALRLIVDEELEEHVHEAEQSVRRKSLGGRELLGEREVGPVGEVVAVDQEELGVARRPVIQLELGAGQGLRRTPPL